MVKKKERKVHVSNRLLYTFITVSIIAILAFGIYALTPGVAPNPGHLITDIAPPSPCSSGQFLQFNSNTWVCTNANTQETNWNANYSNFSNIYAYAINGTSSLWTTVPSANGIIALGKNLVLDNATNITAYTFVPATSYTNYGVCTTDITQDARPCLPGETESNVQTGVCSENPDNFNYVIQRTCTGSGQYKYINRISFPFNSSFIVFSGQIAGDSTGLSPYIHGYISGQVGAETAQNQLIGTIPGVPARCFVFLSGFKEEHCGSNGVCSSTRVAAASCSNSGNTVYGTISGDGIGNTDGIVTCGYICW